MSDATQETFEKALADVFEGRECQFGHGPRKLLRELYDRGRADAAASPSSKIFQPVRDFSELQVGDVFQNHFLRNENRCRRVTRRVSADVVETEFVSTRSKRIVKRENYHRHTFDSFHNYHYIPDPC